MILFRQFQSLVVTRNKFINHGQRPIFAVLDIDIYRISAAYPILFAERNVVQSRIVENPFHYLPNVFIYALEPFFRQFYAIQRSVPRELGIKINLQIIPSGRHTRYRRLRKHIICACIRCRHKLIGFGRKEIKAIVQTPLIMIVIIVHIIVDTCPTHRTPTKCILIEFLIIVRKHTVLIIRINVCIVYANVITETELFIYWLIFARSLV